MAYRVLLVEDHPVQQRYLLDLFLALDGVSVAAVQNGNEALAVLDTQVFDLVLCDLMMPVMDGMQLVQRMRALGHRPSMAFMSALPERMLSSASLAASHLGFNVLAPLAKPVGIETLARMLQKMATPGVGTRPPAAPVSTHSVETLRGAIDSGRIQPWFQPKWSLSTGHIVAAEALVRWADEGRDVLLPRDFLPGIVSRHLEEVLLMQVVSLTIAAQNAWRRQGYGVPVSINLPTHLLDDEDLPDRLHAHVISAGGAPSYIGFEIMESAEAKELGHYFAGVCRLRLKGFGLAQDDFGKGYGSYFNLVSTPFTELKIDRSLVSGCVENANLAAALSSIVALGRQLGLKVVAEGVETFQELALLKQAICDQVQGFLLSKAVSPRSFLSLLASKWPVGC
ncbi:EAL domain-containing response regulator [Pseudomonas plecoglossicida]|uniref:EAL domain-containing response regulator n=1 Tax=Pseudomonas plecoglossicida TaxID=70775 RepID=UPI00048B9707|nr:EAL domain-containing protein [Pseudomonas plecoglossicida]GLR37675.1 transcriptional regulator [Pseudomonas plecoglossicida]